MNQWGTNIRAMARLSPSDDAITTASPPRARRLSPAERRRADRLRRRQERIANREQREAERQARLNPTTTTTTTTAAPTTTLPTTTWTTTPERVIDRERQERLLLQALDELVLVQARMREKENNREFITDTDKARMERREEHITALEEQLRVLRRINNDINDIDL